MMIRGKEERQGGSPGAGVGGGVGGWGEASEGTSPGFHCSQLEGDDSSFPERTWDPFPPTPPHLLPVASQKLELDYHVQG